MMVETYLGPNTKVYTKKHISRGYEVISGLDGNILRNDLYVTPISYDRSGPDIRHIVMFGPISSTSFKGDKAQPK